MTRPSPLRMLLLALLACVPAAVNASAAAQDKLVEQWAQKVWSAALDGDVATVERQLERAPVQYLPQSKAERFQSALAMRQANRAAAQSERIEARDKALDEMRQHMAQHDLSKALRSAVEVQTLSDDFDSAFQDPDIQQLIDWARNQIPAVRESGDWLQLQEILFRLRTLYEDTTRHEDYAFYDDQLEQVNRRIALLSRYAPRTLHELRSQNMERLGEEPLGDFNPGNAMDLADRLRGIDHRMLIQSLRTAASEHIETQGWRPLLIGGLEALRLIATTDSLRESFPELGNPPSVRRWIDHIEKELRDLSNVAHRNLDGWAAARLLDRIVAANEQSVRLPKELIFREFGDGAMQKLDQFTEIIWPDNLRRFRQATEGNFVGVGILIRHNEMREIVVVNPLEGTPAYFAGIKPEDIIVQVDGESTVGWSLNDAVDRITGPKGAIVTLGIRREGEPDLLQVPVQRDTIRIYSVKGWWKTGLSHDGEPTWNWFVDEANRVAYIRLTSFNEDSYNDLRRAWREIKSAGGANGLILDLRYNPGGLLTSAVQISNMFMRSGVIVSGENKDGIRDWHQRARGSMAELADVPTVILINKGSASGSEIVAGALQAHGAAVVVGERSYGKGSVQTVHQVAPNAALKLTTQYYRLPPAPGEQRGRLVHRRPGADDWGVDPDIEVTMSPSQFEQWYKLRQDADIMPDGQDGQPDPSSAERPDINEMLTKGIDPQLETALLLLQARALGKPINQQRHAAHIE